MSDLEKMMQKMIDNAPTKAELKIITKSKFDIQNSVSIGNYSCNNFKYVSYKLELTDETMSGFNGKISKNLKDTLVNFVYHALEELNSNRLFFKNQSRSSKDYGITPLTKRTADDIVHMIFASERMLDDFCLYGYHQDYINLIFKPWLDIKNEYRAFMINGNVIALCDNINYKKRTPTINPKKAESLYDKINKCIECTLSDIPQNCVIDIAKVDNYFTILEVNPWEYSDPIYFNNYEILNAIKNPCVFTNRGIITL